jgi:hypothetical protein
MGSVDFHQVGLVGLIDFVLLSIIVLWRWLSYLQNSVFAQQSATKWRKHLLYCLLLVTSVCNIPLYASFMVRGDYTIAAYSFHKFEAAAIFGAYSLVINDWSRVLFKIREGTFVPFLLRNVTLLFVNVVLTTISIVNFGYCYSTASLNHYANSDIYLVGLFVQIIAPFLLTCMMLHAGLRLYLRIQGAAGRVNNATDNNESKEFRSALFLLITVMVSVGVVTFIQVEYLHNYSSQVFVDVDHAVCCRSHYSR